MGKIILVLIIIAAVIGVVYWFSASDNNEESPTPPTSNNEEVNGEIPIAYTDISVEDAQALIDENPELVIIDVSSAYDDGHLPGAVNYYVGDGSLDTAIPTLDSMATYLVYCHTDEASILGAQALVDAGFENVYRLEGNYSAWVDAGYPVE